jgi:protein-disulfide isomerase
MSSSFDQPENSEPRFENSEPQSENPEKMSINKSSFKKIIVGIVIAIAAASFFAGTLLGSSSAEMNSNYLTKSDMQNMINFLDKKLDTVQAPTAQPSQAQVQPSQPSLFQVSLDDDPVKGDPDAPITIIEFSDFQCPFCSRWYDQTLSQLEENYIDTGKAKLVYRDLPLDSIHPNAKTTHIAAECADEQDQFWDYHDMLFENQSQWNRLSSDDLSTKLIEFADTLELNTVSFESCLSSQEIADEVNADILDARELGATGTPTFFIGNEKDGFVKLVGAQPYASFENMIDSQLG